MHLKLMNAVGPSSKWINWIAVVDNSSLIKWKDRNYHTGGTLPKSNRNIVKRDNIDTCNINIRVW